MILYYCIGNTNIQIPMSNMDSEIWNSSSWQIGLTPLVYMLYQNLYLIHLSPAFLQIPLIILMENYWILLVNQSLIMIRFMKSVPHTFLNIILKYHKIPSTNNNIITTGFYLGDTIYWIFTVLRCKPVNWLLQAPLNIIYYVPTIYLLPLHA